MDVIGMGNPCVDLVAHVAKMPSAGDSTSLLATSIQGSGKVATAMITLARLGASCGVIGTVGRDRHGRFCREDFERHGVDTSCLITDETAVTPFAIVLTDDATRERTILYRRGREGRVVVPKAENMQGARILHLETAHSANQEAVRLMKASGGLVSVDADYYQAQMDEMTPLVDVFIGSSYYYKALFSSGSLESNMRALQDRGPGLVVFTFGTAGCAGLDHGRFFHVDAFPVDVADTTGAGDVFHGAFLYGVLQGWDSRQCAVFASAAAAIKCTLPGGRAGIPDKAIVEMFLKTGTIDKKALASHARLYDEEDEQI